MKYLLFVSLLLCSSCLADTRIVIHDQILSKHDFRHPFDYSEKTPGFMRDSEVVSTITVDDDSTAILSSQERTAIIDCVLKRDCTEKNRLFPEEKR